MAVTDSTAPPRRTRLDAEDRRRQLIGIGLQLLATRPIHQITIDEVAASAGISRSLLFHYFPTKQDYYVAVVRAASRRLLRRIAPDHDTPAPAQIHAIVSDYVTYLERRREPYIALFRSPSADDWVRSIHEETQDALTHRVLAALSPDPQPPTITLVIRAWWSFAEELALTWTGTRPSNRDSLVDLLVKSLHAVIDAATEAP
ncbi:MAG TPA: TetR/AcrR family transcriptional regulator [Actinophytocola sp.]|uniref:TetR/AcrR family transcriptional regulator n=1 Tax=Actinophytocola sp. TaxID=1872138 RepID=UPI002DDD65CC|nr:TetR/AcrR family transcriptional regulator [Actinophytocola sp.]HEV2782426.1 TetR/AcrR family transcriptional regulator [Actinophytocola sp.]